MIWYQDVPPAPSQVKCRFPWVTTLIPPREQACDPYPKHSRSEPPLLQAAGRLCADVRCLNTEGGIMMRYQDVPPATSQVKFTFPWVTTLTSIARSYFERIHSARSYQRWCEDVRNRTDTAQLSAATPACSKPLVWCIDLGYHSHLPHQSNPWLRPRCHFNEGMGWHTASGRQDGCVKVVWRNEPASRSPRNPSTSSKTSQRGEKD